MSVTMQQAEMFGIISQRSRPPFRLRVNDVVRIDGRLCRIIRVTDCAAVVLMSQPRRAFKTRFDKPVGFQPSPRRFRISPNSEVEIVNRPVRAQKKRKEVR